MRPIHTPPALASLALAFALSAAGSVHAQSSARPDDALRSAVQRAIGSNPEVNAKLNLLRSAVDAVDIARGGLLPQVALDASVAQDRDKITNRSPETVSQSRSGGALTLNQLLWDGGVVRREVSRLGHDKLARYFDLLDTTEQTALEAARAYEDVLRYRRLVALAEDNYVQHRYAMSQIQARFKAGVGRGVDQEQALARLALAESNLSTEVSNLHDVTARYVRLIGEAPPAELGRPSDLSGVLPASASDAMTLALRDNAAINAAIENLRAARDLTDEKRSALWPRIEARVRAGGGRNFDGVADQRYDSTAQIVMNWTLYDGGANQARIRQQARLVDQAADLRDKACRDVRQTAAIAYNDTRKLGEQIEALDRNALAIEKARDAYRQQFDIGQRSLLDLLNSENELYTARRALANARFDLEVARLRALASMQRLTTQLGLAKAELGPDVAEAAQWDAGADVPTRCPVLVTEVQSTPRSELDARAQSLVNNAPQPSAKPASR